MSEIAEGGPARSALAVTPHDTSALTPGSRALFVGTSGNITGRVVDDSADVTFVGVPAGIFAIRFSHIRATGTAAEDILALY